MDATVRASLQALDADARNRWREITDFGEDVDIPSWPASMRRSNSPQRQLT